MMIPLSSRFPAAAAAKRARPPLRYTLPPSSSPSPLTSARFRFGRKGSNNKSANKCAYRKENNDKKDSLGRAVQVDPGFSQLIPRLLSGTFSS